MPDRIDSLLYDLEDHTGHVSVRLIRAWQYQYPAQPTLDDVMAAFIADYPNGHLMVRHDPERESHHWTATAYYSWRLDAETPEKAITALRVSIEEATIAELPTLPEGFQWVLAPPSRMWMPIRDDHAATLQGTASRAPTFGTPPPGSVVFDIVACDERLYVPVKA